MFNTFKKWFVSYSFLMFYLLLILTFPTNESVTLPGNTQDTKQIYRIDGYDTVSFETIYIINYEPLTYFQRAILELSQRADIRAITDYEESLSQLEMFQVGQIQKESSYHLSVITAYQKANQVIDYQFKGYALISKPNSTSNLHIGDLILTINGLPLEENTSLTPFLNETTLTLDIIRDETLMTVTYVRNTDDIPLYVYPMFQINEAIPTIDLFGMNSLIGGPSSGMMMTLSIYASLRSFKIDDIIAGTGTIELDGSVGRIGGLVQKYYTVYDHVDYMLVPKEQLVSLNGLDTQKIVAVETIDDAISFLETLL